MSAPNIDTSLTSIWRSWYRYRLGKCKTAELDVFQYNLEKNLYNLYVDLNTGGYRHGPYRQRVVADTKRRQISIATIRDRVVHRLLYDYLVGLFDKTFAYDAWSCRKSKGLIGAIKRSQTFLRLYPDGFVWRADIKKFFDNVDRKVLYNLLERKIKARKTLWLLRAVINSCNRDTACHEREREGE